MIESKTAPIIKIYFIFYFSIVAKIIIDQEKVLVLFFQLLYCQDPKAKLIPLFPANISQKKMMKPKASSF